MLKASLLYYQQFTSDIEKIGYIINPYDACVANKMINNKQHTLTWHVDDVKSSHVDPKINDNFKEWCEEKYGSDDLGHVTVNTGKRHDYIGHSKRGKTLIDMTEYM